MKKQNLYKLIFLFILPLFYLQSCSVDDALMTDKEIAYKINERNDSNIKGELIFSELKDGRIQAQLQLDNTQNGTMLPTSLNANSAAEGGETRITLDPVDGATGSSVTLIERDDNGHLISFDGLIALDAHLQVVRSMSADNNIVASGDIGVNALTGEEKSYQIREGLRGDLKGKVTFRKRQNGFTLAEIEMDDLSDENNYSAAIYFNSAVEGGNLWIDLKSINPEDEIIYKDIRRSAIGASVDYENITASNAHIQIFENNTTYAQGDIGLNVLTGESISYDLASASSEDVDGEVIFFEREDGSVLALVEIDETFDTGRHPVYIRANSVTEGGPILITLNPVDGSTGESFSSLRMTDNMSPFNFQIIENYNGHMQVLMNEYDSSLILAEGNIGVNTKN